MATVTHTYAAANATRFGPGQARQVLCAAAIKALATTELDNANDGTEMFWVPKGAVICGILLRVTDMDESTGLLFDVGDSVDDDRLLQAFSGQAAGASTALAAAGFLYKYDADTKIILSVNTAATTPAAGTAYLCVYYFMDENWQRLTA